MPIRNRNSEILERLAAMEQRLERIETALGKIDDSTSLRAELELKQSELVALGEQGLHVVEMLDATRKELESTKAELERARAGDG